MAESIIQSNKKNVDTLEELSKHVNEVNKKLAGLQERVHNLEQKVIGVHENTFKYIKGFFVFSVGYLWVSSGCVTYGTLSDNIIFLLGKIKEEFGLSYGQEVSLLKCSENLINNLRREFSCCTCIFGLSIILNRSNKMIIETNELNESIEQNINNDTNYKQIIDELRSKRSQIEDYLFDIETISKIHQRLKRQRDFRNDNKSEIMHTLEKLLKICSLKDLGEIIFILFEELSDLEKKNSNNRDTTRLQNKNFKKIKNIVNYLILHKRIYLWIFL
ncbi:a-type inclusion protein [Anaeramoeba flamelloides]|uniref:A-type inclusion protein n=1 Tax=Anaeramoeba flamelloides TaxID=1746091 RepID=A0ABQ8Y8H0_9EUKA|nr:a-type inclusion protein [Anaeramoeba flamelloides]